MISKWFILLISMELAMALFSENQQSNNKKLGVLSLPKARAKVASLQKERQDIKSRLRVEKEIALGKFQLENRPLKERIDTPPEPKDEFETTVQYEARLRKHREQIDPLKKKYETGYNAIMRKYEEESENNDRNITERYGKTVYTSTPYSLRTRPISGPVTKPGRGRLGWYCFYWVLWLITGDRSRGFMCDRYAPGG